MLTESNPFYLLLMLLKYLLGELTSLVAPVALLVLVLSVGGCFATAMQDRIDSFDARIFLLRILSMILWAVFSGVKVTVITFAKSRFGSSSFSFGIARPSALPAGQGEALAHNNAVAELQGPVVDVVNSFLLRAWSTFVNIGSWLGQLLFRLPCNRPSRSRTQNGESRKTASGMSHGSSSSVYMAFTSKLMLAIITDDNFFAAYVTKALQYMAS